MKFTIEFHVIKYCVLGKHHFFLYPLTKIDLLKPLVVAERAIDTPAHWHNRT